MTHRIYPSGLAAAPIWLEPRQRLLLFYLDVMQYRAWTFFAPACSVGAVAPEHTCLSVKLLSALGKRSHAHQVSLGLLSLLGRR